MLNRGNDTLSARLLFLSFIIFLLSTACLYPAAVTQDSLVSSNNSGPYDSSESYDDNEPYDDQGAYYGQDYEDEYDEPICLEDYQWISLGLNANILNNSNYKPLYQAEFTTGRYIGRDYYVQLIMGYGQTGLKKRSSLKKDIEGRLSSYTIGLEFKTLVPSYYTEVVQYFLLGLSFNNIAWDYNRKNSYYNDNGDHIFEDRLTGADLHAGLGFILMQSKKWQFCSEVCPGYIFPDNSTSEGFDNDILKKTFYLKVKLAFYFATKKF